MDSSSIIYFFGSYFAAAASAGAGSSFAHLASKWVGQWGAGEDSVTVCNMDFVQLDTLDIFYCLRNFPASCSSWFCQFSVWTDVARAGISGAFPGTDTHILVSTCVFRPD